MVVVMEPTTIQGVVLKVGVLTDEAIRNGSIKKNPEKRGNGGEPSKLSKCRFRIHFDIHTKSQSLLFWILQNNSQNNALECSHAQKLGEYEMWEIRIKQYFQIQDYALWEVIENGNSWVPIPVTTPESGPSTALKMMYPYPEEKICNNSIVDTSNLQTELDCTKEKLETCIIKKEKEYIVLWNNWYKKCEECKYDKISYDKAYNDMQQKIERLQARLGDLKGKSKDTPCVSDTLDPLSQKLEDENVALEFQVLNYAKENEHLKIRYKNLFDSINVTRAQTKLITDSLQEILQDTVYENAMLRA
ncbi:hypothetical protein Tco_0821214 [Tanacetum coccineum]|uniref:Uncharacterized protein n=1 Tax=Tanacetum coccineum TaxID=301880 RepID=A0ABQ5ABM1_9ASTR